MPCELVAEDGGSQAALGGLDGDAAGDLTGSLPIDRVGHGEADFLLLEGLKVLVERKVPDLVARGGVTDDTLNLAGHGALDVLGLDLGSDIDLAGLKATMRAVSSVMKRMVQVFKAGNGAPVLVVADQGDVAADDPLDELERAGADRALLKGVDAVGLDKVLADDVGTAMAQGS